MKPWTARGLAVLIFSIAACSSERAAIDTSGEGPPPGDESPPASGTTTPASTSPPTAAEAPCKTGVVETCSAFDTRSYCVESGGKRTWREEKCAAGCFAGKCVADACADECALGAKTSAGTCRLWDVKTKSVVAANPTASLHDRARDYEQRLRSTSLLHGQVLDVHYTDATLSTPSYYSGYRDAAIWTGSALAAEAWRLSATREPDAARQVEALVKTIHRSFEVTGTPGYLARMTQPSASPVPLGLTNRCADPEWHCDVPLAGQKYDWVGGTSRDQNTGVMLGYAMAYLATTDEALKKTIRDDVMAFAGELMKVRKGVPARVVVNGIPLDKSLDLENVLLLPAEMTSGRITINLDTNEAAESEIQGMREFFPDFSVLVKQVLGINVPIPRSSTAMMLGGFFRLALRIAEDDPALAAKRAEMGAYFASHAPAWLSTAETWTFETRDGCGRGYFSTHIAYIMAYVWALLENDPALAPRVRDKLFDQAMWKAVAGHKNAYFAFLWGGTRVPAIAPSNPAIQTAASQLAQFQAGPRVWAARDNRANPKYLPHDTKCTAEVLCNIQNNSVDVGDRRIDDFLWQRQPWQLYDGGDPTKVYPGVDYLAAYWAARRHGFATDDRAGTCTRVMP
ncbi:MAG: hypothetical protein JST00_34265 [Deltaproteobacteria bacterium]|nr:hypothetical protein [Deltaproteobacteria bacterium]